MPEIVFPPVDLGVVIQPLIIFSWATILLLVDLVIPMDRKRLTGYLATVGILVAAAAGIPQWDHANMTMAGMVKIDNVALMFNWIFLGTAGFSLLLAHDWMARQNLERGEVYVLILLAIGGMMVMSQANDLIVVFLGLELLSLCLYILTGYTSARLSSEEAAMKYLLYGAFAAGFLVFGIALVFGATGTSNLTEIDLFLRRQTLLPEDQALMYAGMALVIIGLGYKIGMAPFHMWVPDVYEGAPTPVTAFMMVGTKAAGFAALTRVMVDAFSSRADVWVPALSVLAGLTLIVGNIGALRQMNVKRMLAYSSISHAGYLLMGIIAAGVATAGAHGIEAVLFYLVAYGLANMLAFGIMLTLVQPGENNWDLSTLQGMWAKRPWLGIAMAVSMLSLAGLPPSAGFFAKLSIFTAAWEAHLQWLVLVALLTSVIGIFYYLRIIVQMLMRDPVRPVRPVVGRELAGVIGVATVFVILIGILPTPLINLVQQTLIAGR